MQGFYSLLTQAAGQPALTVNQAEKLAGTQNPTLAFAAICAQLQSHASPLPQIFDAVLIDEAQDMPPSFYQMAWASLRPPKRLYWAYDEVQNLGAQQNHTAAELFGPDYEVNLSGAYPGGIPKSVILRRIYRNPTEIHLPALALGMGLFRPDHPLQGRHQCHGMAQLGI